MSDLRLRIWALLAGFVLAFFMLGAFLSHVVIKPEEMAFGSDTTNILGGVGDLTTYCLGANDSVACEASYANSGKPKAVLWLGNSQLPAINRFQQGQENAPQLLFKWLRNRDRYLITYSQPNANLAEHAVVFGAASQRYNLDLVLLPVVFDDLRESGIRAIVADFTHDPKVLRQLKNSGVWTYVEPSLKRTTEMNETAEPAQFPSLQELTETWITSVLAEHWNLWKRRPEMRGTFASALHLLRNRILGIHSYTKRYLNPGIFAERMALLERFVQEMKARGVSVMLYVPPYRTDIDGPYVTRQYEQFKRQLAELAQRNAVGFSDFENLVPGPQWATVTDRIFGFKEPDFMHFTAEGHLLFAHGMAAELQKRGY